MDNETEKSPASSLIHAEIAELPEACLKKIDNFERELNKEGFWNIALVAYQLRS